MKAMTLQTRYVVAAASMVILTSIIGATFWYQDWRYSLPTPKPAHLHQAPVGTRFDLPTSVVGTNTTALSARPVLLHFFNPECPCSKFNIEHLRGLLARYPNVDCIAIIQTESSNEADEAWQTFQRLQLPIPAVIDSTGSLAAMYGVYSTPQAVVLTSTGELYYRGNYNKSRYCVDRSTEFVRIVLDSIFAGVPPPQFEHTATTAYGCELPANIRAVKQ